MRLGTILVHVCLGRLFPMRLVSLVWSAWHESSARSLAKTPARKRLGTCKLPRVCVAKHLTKVGSVLQNGPGDRAQAERSGQRSAGGLTVGLQSLPAWQQALTNQPKFQQCQIQSSRPVSLDMVVAVARSCCWRDETTSAKFPPGLSEETGTAKSTMDGDVVRYAKVLWYDTRRAAKESSSTSSASPATRACRTSSLRAIQCCRSAKYSPKPSN